MTLTTEHPLMRHFQFANEMVAAELNRAEEARNGNPFIWSGCVTTEDQAYEHAALWMIAAQESKRLLLEME